MVYNVYTTHKNGDDLEMVYGCLWHCFPHIMLNHTGDDDLKSIGRSPEPQERYMRELARKFNLPLDQADSEQIPSTGSLIIWNKGLDCRSYYY